MSYAKASSIDILTAHLTLNAVARLSSHARTECDLSVRQAELVWIRLISGVDREKKGLRIQRQK